MAEIKGDLVLMPLADLVIWFANRGVDGVLTVESGPVRKDFTLKGGRCTRAASNDPREYLGQFLVHFGLITEDQLQRAFDTQRETKVLLGRILVMIGIVPEEMVVQALQVKISETMLDAFRWKAGRFQFISGLPDDPRPEVEVGVSLADVHREGVHRAGMWEEFNRVFNLSMYLTVWDKRIPPAASLDTLDGRILALARHGMSIEAITLELHATDYQVAARLYELYRAGAIEPREPSETLNVADVGVGAGPVNHAELARKALADADYSGAFRHARASMKADPGNTELSHLTDQIERKFREEIQAEIVSKDSVPVLLKEVDDRQSHKLNAKQRYILARIDGKRSVQAIIQVSPMRDIEALEILRGFLREGLVQLAQAS